MQNRSECQGKLCRVECEITNGTRADENGTDEPDICEPAPKPAVSY